MTVELNSGFEKLSENYLFSEVARRVCLARDGSRKIISLGIGDVSLPLPKVALSAMQKAVAEMGNRESFRGYPPSEGYEFARRTIASYYRESMGTGVGLDEIYLSDGAKNNLSDLMDLFGRAEVVVPSPAYPAYSDVATIKGKRVTRIMTENGEFLPENLDNSPKIIVICSPDNPTGRVMSSVCLKKWVDFALKSGSIIVFDGAYEAFVRDGNPRSIFAVEGAERCAIEVGSLSKSASFTGVRFSWVIVPNALKVGDVPLFKLWKRRQSTCFNGVGYVVQRAAEAVFNCGREEMRQMTDYYLENAKILGNALHNRFDFSGGVNSPYLWLKTPKGTPSWDFFDILLQETGLVSTPGVGFGEGGEGFVRLSCLGTREDIEEAAGRLAKF